VSRAVAAQRRQQDGLPLRFSRNFRGDQIGELFRPPNSTCGNLSAKAVRGRHKAGAEPEM